MGRNPNLPLQSTGTSGNDHSVVITDVASASVQSGAFFFQGETRSDGAGNGRMGGE